MSNAAWRKKYKPEWTVYSFVVPKYRIADPAFKGGRAVKVPNAKGGMDSQTFRYGQALWNLHSKYSTGQAVSRKRVQRDRELFKETHVKPGQCPEWWDILNFFP